MPAREKINHAYANGALLLGTLAGLATGSWAVFAGAVLLSLALSVSSGEIRLTPRNRKH